jgi:hypothetical protein
MNISAGWPKQEYKSESPISFNFPHIILSFWWIGRTLNRWIKTYYLKGYKLGECGKKMIFLLLTHFAIICILIRRRTMLLLLYQILWKFQLKKIKCLPISRCRNRTLGRSAKFFLLQQWSVSVTQVLESRNDRLTFDISQVIDQI